MEEGLAAVFLGQLGDIDVAVAHGLHLGVARPGLHVGPVVAVHEVQQVDPSTIPKVIIPFIICVCSFLVRFLFIVFEFCERRAEGWPPVLARLLHFARVYDFFAWLRRRNRMQKYARKKGKPSYVGLL